VSCGNKMERIAKQRAWYQSRTLTITSMSAPEPRYQEALVDTRSVVDSMPRGGSMEPLAHQLEYLSDRWLSIASETLTALTQQADDLPTL